MILPESHPLLSRSSAERNVDVYSVALNCWQLRSIEHAILRLDLVDELPKFCQARRPKPCWVEAVLLLPACRDFIAEGCLPKAAFASTHPLDSLFFPLHPISFFLPPFHFSFCLPSSSHPGKRPSKLEHSTGRIMEFSCEDQKAFFSYNFLLFSHLFSSPTMNICGQNSPRRCSFSLL